LSLFFGERLTRSIRRGGPWSHRPAGRAAALILEPDDFGRNRNAISSKVLNPPLLKELEHDVIRKPFPLFGIML
jgi:hypothetical protein